MKTVFALLLTAALVACKPAPPSDVEVAGQVFIRTKAGANVTLGGVRVLLVPAAIAEQRERETEAAERTERASVEKAWKEWEAEMTAKRAAHEVARRMPLALMKESDRLEKILANNAAGMLALPVKEREKVAAANRECMANLRSVGSQLTRAEEEARQLGAELSAAAGRKPVGPDDILDLVPRLARLKWPEAVAEATTDADGRFLLRAKPGVLAVVSKSVRPLPLTDKVELYFWRVPLQTNQTSVMLTDANARSMTGVFSDGRKADAGE